MPNGKRALMVATASLLFGFALSGASHAQSQSELATCEFLLTEQWRALWDRNQVAANKILARARQAYCLQPPIDVQLCYIPIDQEILADLDNRPDLANRARQQQVLLRCAGAADSPGYDGGR